MLLVAPAEALYELVEGSVLFYGQITHYGRAPSDSFVDHGTYAAKLKYQGSIAGRFLLGTWPTGIRATSFID